MVDAVKSIRTYQSPRRREQAAATRRHILAAAQALFERDGYAMTSMPAIAEAAGVAVKTVYVVFETKPNLLRVLWDERLSGDEVGVPVTQRAWYREFLEEQDPERQLGLVTAHGGAVKVRSGALMEVIRDAATVDADIARLWDDIQHKLLNVARSIIEELHEKRALGEGLDVDAATDILWTLNHPSVWQLLVRERGWSAEAYERWLRQTLSSQVLGTLGRGISSS